MAKVLLDGDHVAIRVSWLERLMLAEKPRRVPILSIRSVDPHPRIVDMMVHWADQSAVWLGGVSSYDGHLIPSTKNPEHTLAIDLDEDERIFVELDDERPVEVAARIEVARREKSGLPPPPDATEDEPLRPSQVQIQLAQMVQAAQAADADEGDDEWDDDVRLRDPLMQGSLLPPPPPSGRVPEVSLSPKHSEPAPELRLDDDRDLSKLGGWLVGLGGLGVLTGGTIMAAGLLPGVLAVGAGLACGLMGGVALMVVANHD